jgi:hypothetical protein
MVLPVFSLMVQELLNIEQFSQRKFNEIKSKYFHIGKLIKPTNSSGHLSKKGSATTTHGEEVLRHFSCG